MTLLSERQTAIVQSCYEATMRDDTTAETLKPRVRLDDLPMEILIQIAAEVGVYAKPQFFPHSRRCGTPGMALGSVNRRVRQAFLENIQKSCVMVRVQFRGESSDDLARLQQDLDQTFHCPQASALYDHISSPLWVYNDEPFLDTDLSILNIVVMPNHFGNHHSTVPVTFVAQKLRMVQLCQLLKHNIDPYDGLEVSCKAQSKASAHGIKNLLHDLGNLVNGFDEATIWGDDEIMSIHHRDVIIAHLTQKDSSRTLSGVNLQHSHYLSAMSELVEGGVPYDALLTISAEALCDITVRTKRHVQVWSLESREGLKYGHYVAYVLRGLGDYLLSSSNSPEEQSHHLLEDGTTFKLRALLTLSVTVCDITKNFDFKQRSLDFFTVTMKIVQARTQFSLALARTSTNSGFLESSIVGPLKSDRSIPENVATTLSHLDDARMFANALQQGFYAYQTHFRKSKVNWKEHFAWMSTVQKIAADIERASRDRWAATSREILMEPMLQLRDSKFLF